MQCPMAACSRFEETQVGSTIEISVADTGVGIKQEDLDRIMEPLYTTKARGIGLGLAIARAILDKHNGRLTVTSECGRGTTFVVYAARRLIYCCELGTVS